MGQVYWGVQGAISQMANPIALMLGDSWFWYPIDNLANEISPAFPTWDLVVVGSNGSEAQDWALKQRKEIDFAFKMYASGVQALMLSGGGNDIAGSADFLRILADNCSKATNVSECYRVGQPAAIVGAIIAAYAQVIGKFRTYNSEATVLVHNYDFAWPTGRGLFGPADWLKVPMDRAKVPKVLRRELLRDLLRALRSAQLKLGELEDTGPFSAIASAGTLPDNEDWWANELHPTPDGFRLLANKAFIPALLEVVTP